MSVLLPGGQTISLLQFPRWKGYTSGDETLHSWSGREATSLQAISDTPVYTPPPKKNLPGVLTRRGSDQPTPSLTHTPLLGEEQQETGDTFKHFSHDHSGGGKEAITRQCTSISDAKDEGGVLDHQHS